MAIDYFTKWDDAKALVSITLAKIKEFVYKNIIYRYGVPHIIILDNGKQFDCNEFYDNLFIRRYSRQSHNPKLMVKLKLSTRQSSII